jgi:TolB-like protein/DNA-binding winged helix-turn-helix (wHTH) protein
MRVSDQPRVYRFGVFAFDASAGELRKRGIKIKIHGQPVDILLMLLERPGEVVTREEIQKQLWPSDTFVDFEHSLNAAVKRLRDGLGDSAETPQYVETLARRGYRLIVPVERYDRPRGRVAGLVRRPYVWAGALALGLAAVMLVWLNPVGSRGRSGVVVSKSPIRSVAVLPLENLSNDPEQEYFAIGITDALITDLAKIKSLRVISRTSAMHYKATKKTLPEIARELGVDSIVEGTVARAGNRVRITAQLIRVEGDQHIWAESYESQLNDILMVQREIALAVATHVQSELGGKEKANLLPVRVTNPAAYDAFLKGRFYYFKAGSSNPEHMHKSVDYFSDSIRVDPSYAPAYVGLSDAYLSLSVSGSVPPLEFSQKSKVALAKALELDPDLGEAHYSLARNSEYVDFNWATAEREFTRALQLNPNYAHGRQMRALYLIVIGHPQQGIEEQKIALTLDPLNPAISAHLARDYIFARDYDEAIVQARRTLEIYPDFEEAHYWLQFAYARKGMDRAVFDDRQSFLRRVGKKQEADLETRIYSERGLRGLLQKDLKFFMTEAPSDSIGIAESYTELGEKQPAMKYLLKAYQERDPRVVNISVHPSYDLLRSEPEFQDLMARLHYPKP